VFAITFDVVDINASQCREHVQRPGEIVAATPA